MSNPQCRFALKAAQWKSRLADELEIARLKKLKEDPELKELTFQPVISGGGVNGEKKIGKNDGKKQKTLTGTEVTKLSSRLYNEALTQRSTRDALCMQAMKDKVHAELLECTFVPKMRSCPKRRRASVSPVKERRRSVLVRSTEEREKFIERISKKKNGPLEVNNTPTRWNSGKIHVLDFEAGFLVRQNEKDADKEAELEEIREDMEYRERWEGVEDEGWLRSTMKLKLESCWTEGEGGGTSIRRGTYWGTYPKEEVKATPPSPKSQPTQHRNQQQHQQQQQVITPKQLQTRHSLHLSLFPFALSHLLSHTTPLILFAYPTLKASECIPQILGMLHGWKKVKGKERKMFSLDEVKEFVRRARRTYCFEMLRTGGKYYDEESEEDSKNAYSDLAVSNFASALTANDAFDLVERSCPTLMCADSIWLTEGEVRATASIVAGKDGRELNLTDKEWGEVKKRLVGGFGLSDKSNDIVQVNGTLDEKIKTAVRDLLMGEGRLGGGETTEEMVSGLRILDFFHGSRANCEIDDFSGAVTLFDVVLEGMGKGGVIEVIRGGGGERVGGRIEEKDLQKGMEKVWEIVATKMKEEGDDLSFLREAFGMGGKVKKGENKTEMGIMAIDNVRDNQRDKSHLFESHRRDARKRVLYDSVMLMLDEATEEEMKKKEEVDKWEGQREKQVEKRKKKERKKERRERRDREREMKKARKREKKEREREKENDTEGITPETIHQMILSESVSTVHKNDNNDKNVLNNSFDAFHLDKSLRPNPKSEHDRLHTERRKLKNSSITRQFEQDIFLANLEEEQHLIQRGGDVVVIRGGEEKIVEGKLSQEGQNKLALRLAQPRHVKLEREKNVPEGHSNLRGRQRPPPEEEARVAKGLRVKLSPEKIDGWVRRQAEVSVSCFVCA